MTAGERPQLVIPAGTWFAVELALAATHCLFGCTVAPGFDFADFELAAGPELAARFPGARRAHRAHDTAWLRRRALREWCGSCHLGTPPRWTGRDVDMRAWASSGTRHIGKWHLPAGQSIGSPPSTPPGTDSLRSADRSTDPGSGR